MQTLIDNEAFFRLGVFAGAFLILILLEFCLPRRQLRFDRLIRWPGNLLVTFANTLLVRLIFPLAATGYAAMLESSGTGLLNMTGLQGLLPVILAVVMLDLAIYGQHVLFHRVPLLWHLHRMHHTDNDIDVTTGARFHPLEIILSMVIKFAVITIIGPPAVAVLMFEVILNASAMFNHANIRLPLPFDRLLRTVIVTPDMHRVHHSVIRKETDSNYGFCLSLWDRLFGTYIAQPEKGHTDMTIGLEGTQTIDAQRIDRMLGEPFRPGQR